MISFKSSQFFELKKKTDLVVPVPILNDNLKVTSDFFGEKLEPIGDFPRRVKIGETVFSSKASKILSPVNGIAEIDEKKQVHFRIDGRLNFRAKFERKDYTFLELKDKLNALGIVSLDLPGKNVSSLLDEFDASEDTIVIFAPYTQENFFDYRALMQSKFKQELEAFKANIKKIFHKAQFIDYQTEKLTPYSYPDGHPRYFLYKHCGMNIEGELPVKKILYLGPETVYHILNALYYDIPFHERILSVVVINRLGFQEGENRSYRVRNGTDMKEFLETIQSECGYKYFTVNSFYEKQPVYEIGAEFVFDIYRHHSIIICEELFHEKGEGVCTDCNDCSYFCPVSANPRALLENDKSMFAKDICLSCGLCSVFCPSHIDFADRIRFQKNRVQENAVS
ncbi:MAG TPA: hypothetical protein PL048_04725 [Leptospiraceae bacterium]|nr:hypothetical protein [Leptospiraceae bacterium]HMZ58053.1 hypothetical protein [Leptospiraceae bacterium]HNF15923.1 hypothetical protein [Leptospiraceae bacterium]HNH07209.1 hypothetical protein [Leptospiraceae bacterium]HNI94780.1 hypothetical protein [Leptospiraceae bacterium]